jgi:hypothetical protein
VAAAAAGDVLPADHRAAQQLPGVRRDPHDDPGRAARGRDDDDGVPDLPGDVRQPAGRLRRHGRHDHVRRPAARHAGHPPAPGPRGRAGSERQRATHRHSARAKRRPSISEAVR